MVLINGYSCKITILCLTDICYTQLNRIKTVILAHLKWRKRFTTSRVDIISRTLAAIIGGYLVAATACGLLSITLPLPTAERVLSAMMLSFIFYVIAVLWSFNVKKSEQAWRDLLSISAIFYMSILVVG